MKLSEKIQEALREQQEINLSDPAVQKQLAAQCGYVPAGAQPAPSIPEAVMEVIAGLVYEVERNICPHEETHRGGQWEICDMCGARWADDMGGKPEFKWPEVVEKARDMLEAAPGAQPAPSGPDGFAWPECPKRRQSHVLFDDGYEEGWAACVATIKAAWKSEGQIMCTINDEEPAFPVSTSNPYSGHQDGPNTWQFPGMTLRDYFAAKAMQGLFAAGGGVTRGAGEWASIAYKMADAMLATRKEK
jgi:hypothetical protein